MYSFFRGRAATASIAVIKHEWRMLSSLQSFGVSSANEVYKLLSNRKNRDEAIECNIVTDVIDALAENPARIAIQCFQEDRKKSHTITYHKLAEKSKAIASYYSRKGIKQGDSVALMLGQRQEWWYSLTGLIRAGISVVPCPRLLTEADLLYRFIALSL